MKLTAIGAATALVLSASPLWAVGDEEEAEPTPTETTTTCTDGQIWDPKTETCTAPEDSSFNDTDRYNAARELAYAKRYDDAVRVLASADDPQDSGILTYKGFTARKMGDWDAAMAHYEAAIAADPTNTLARSYMGQGLVEMGRKKDAEAQLDLIAQAGGAGTWPYRALQEALAGRSGY